MPLESTNKISGLNDLWPLGSDPTSQGDNHIRLIKEVLQNDALSLTSPEPITGQLIVQGNSPDFLMYETDQPVDQQTWAISAFEGNWTLRPLTNSGDNQLGFLRLSRDAAGMADAVLDRNGDTALLTAESIATRESGDTRWLKKSDAEGANGYVVKTGDTMTGPLVLDTNNNEGILFKVDAITDEWAVGHGGVNDRLRFARNDVAQGQVVPITAGSGIESGEQLITADKGDARYLLNVDGDADSFFQKGGVTNARSMRLGDLQICWGKFSLVSGDNALVFPAAFSSDNLSITGNAERADNNGRSVVFNSVTKTGCNVRLVDTSGDSGASGNVYWQAMGSATGGWAPG